MKNWLPLLGRCFGSLVALAFKLLKVSAFLLAVCAAPLKADPVLDWTALALDCIRADNTSPPLATRDLAILHTAIYDAVNSITRTHQPYRFQLDAPAEASADAAAVGAAYAVMLTLYPSLEFWADDLYDEWSAAATHDSGFTNGLALGQTIAMLVLSSRSGDGSSTDVPYIPSSAPGQWQRTPPFFRPPLVAYWRNVDLFCLPGLEPFAPEPPPSLDCPEYAAAVNEVRAIGAKNSAIRTPEQSQIAVFWSDFSYTATPAGHWHEIAMGIARSRGNTLAENSRLFALLSLAQADAAIVCWEAKYRYNLWRPVTAIRRADEDGNPATDADLAWESYLVTPPFPSYTSGHSTFSTASAEVLRRFHGTDAITFSAQSDSLPGVVRTFHSLAACADEIGQSRIYGGFHFQFDNRAGKECGQKIGGFIAENFLLLNGQLPRLALERTATGMRLRIQAHVGRSCVLEATTDFQTWQSLSTNTAMAGGITVVLPQEFSKPARFFRVRER